MDWLNSHIDEYMTYVSGHGAKSPFDLPDDVDNYICLQENDYLRLGSHPDVMKAQVRVAKKRGADKASAGVFVSKGSENERFCQRLAESTQAESAILTTAGWTANVGLLEAITPPEKPIYVDFGAHASLWDGAALSSGKPVVVGHNRPGHLVRRIKTYGPGIVAIDAFYSTDGSVPNLRAYVEICEEYNCVMVLDEAHSFGIVGDKGGGLAVELGLQNRIPYRTASLSKALGGHGGFIAGTRKSIDYLRFRCRSILFSSSTAEIIGAGNCAALEIAMKDASRRRVCLDMAQVLRTELQERGISAGDSMCQIVSITLNGAYTATKLYWALREKGVLASVFAYPATPKTRSLLRFSVHSMVTEADMKLTAKLVAQSIEKLGFEAKLANKCARTTKSLHEDRKTGGTPAQSTEPADRKKESLVPAMLTTESLV